MSDESKDKHSVDSDTPTVNMEEIAPAGSVKGLDANRYATKKTVAQGMLDIALLTSNASQLKYVLQVGPKHEFYTLLVVLISISIVLQASAGVLAIVMTFLDVDHSERQKKIADWLYHASVGLMTGVVFCDVIKMTFGLDPALSEKDFFSNVISAIVAIVLSSIYNINREPDLRKAEVLNNTSLAFKTVSIMLNVVISALSSMQIDSASLAIAAATGL